MANETFSSWDFLIQKNATILVVPGILGRVDPSHVLGFFFFRGGMGRGMRYLHLIHLMSDFLAFWLAWKSCV